MEWLEGSALQNLKGTNSMDAPKIIGSFPCKKTSG